MVLSMTMMLSVLPLVTPLAHSSGYTKASLIAELFLYEARQGLS